MTKNKRTTLIFDLSETLVYGLLGVEGRLAALLAIDPHEVLPAFGGELFQDVLCGRMTEEAYLAAVIRKAGWQVEQGMLKHAIRENMHQRVPGMEALVGELAAAGYPLVLATDHVAEWLEYLMAVHPFLGRFHPLFSSCELGSTKREQRTFERILKTLQKNPDECLFIDDNPGNIQTAGQVGLPGIQFLSEADLREKLAAHGIGAGA